MSAEKNKQQIKKELSYQNIVETATKLFAQNGYDKTSVDDIMKESGYSKATFYLHFESKDEFFLHLMDYRLKQFEEEFFKLFKPENNLKQTILNGLRLFFELTERDLWAPIFFEFWSHAMRNDMIKERMQDHYSKWIRLASSVFEQARSTENLPNTINTEAVASLIIALCDGFNLQNQINANLKIEQIERIVLKMLFD